MKLQENGKNIIMRGFVSFIFHICYYADQMRDSWIGGACSTHGNDEEYIRFLSRKSEGEETRWKTWLCVYRSLILTVTLRECRGLDVGLLRVR